MTRAEQPLPVSWKIHNKTLLQVLKKEYIDVSQRSNVSESIMSSSFNILSGSILPMSRRAVQDVITQSPAATDTARMAVREARTVLAGLLSREDTSYGRHTESGAFLKAVIDETNDLKREYFYTDAQAIAVKLSDLARFQLMAELAGDNEMLENIRRAKAYMIQALATPSLLSETDPTIG